MRAIFLAVLLCMGGLVNAAEVETMFRLGPSQMGERLTGSGMFSVTQRVNDRYDFSLGIIGKQEVDMCGRPDCIWEIEQQVWVGARLLVEPLWFWTDKLKFGFGPTLWARPDRFVSSFLRVNLYLEWRFDDALGVSAEHFSIASAGLPLKACNKEKSFCDQREFNNGQDSWYGINVFKRFGK